jgi:hypothetical protein
MLAVLVGVPYFVASALWRLPLPYVARTALALAVPGVLIWWLETSPDFRDITSPGAALLPVALIGGWSLGTLAQLRQGLLDHLDGKSLVEDVSARWSSCFLSRK